jgi:transposase
MVFALRGSRAATTITELPGMTLASVMGCDRAKMYSQCGRLQWFRARLKRDFQALIDDAHHQVKRLGHDFMRPTKELFRHWSGWHHHPNRLSVSDVTDPPHDRSLAAAARIPKCQSAFDRHVWELYAQRDWLWTFVDIKNVEPTNSTAEQSLRLIVIWRNLFFGTQSAAGSRFVETPLTTIKTCRRQERDILDFVTRSVQAHLPEQITPLNATRGVNGYPLSKQACSFSSP